MTPPTTPEAPLPPLDAEEAELLRSFEAGEWQPVSDMLQEIARYAAYARATLAAQKRVTIRLAEPDVQALQLKAREEGLPYHALLASILHKYATGQLVAPKPEAATAPSTGRCFVVPPWPGCGRLPLRTDRNSKRHCALAPRERPQPRLAHGSCGAPSAVWQPRRRAVESGAVRLLCCWTRATGWGRGGRTDVPRGESLGKGGIGKQRGGTGFILEPFDEPRAEAQLVGKQRRYAACSRCSWLRGRPHAGDGYRSTTPSAHRDGDQSQRWLDR